MNNSEVIETIGSITKVESVISVEQNLFENFLILKNIDPFPGFHKVGDKLKEQKSESFFLILRNRYDPEKVNHINRELSNDKIVSFYPSFGEINTLDTIYSCIRIKGIEKFSQIPLIQEYFKKHELHFLEYHKVNCNAMIKIFKIFKIIEISDGLYRDLDDGQKIYIRIPKSIDWKTFESVTKKIKYNLENRNFDSALGIIYRFCGSENVIRIYDEEKTLERALLIKKMYIREIKNSLRISALNL
jgi:hypothetical protein